MRNDWLTDEQIEQEIIRLKDSEHVRLARKEQRLKYKQRQYCYTLRNLEKRGKQLAAEGITYDNIDSVMFGELVEAEA